MIQFNIGNQMKIHHFCRAKRVVVYSLSSLIFVHMIYTLNLKQSNKNKEVGFQLLNININL